MAKLKVSIAREKLMQYQPGQVDDHDVEGFKHAVDRLIHEVQVETELALIKGRVRFLGEPYLLYRVLESVVGMERRPIHRDAAIQQIRDALGKYLGLDFNPAPAKSKRRKLLPHV